MKLISVSLLALAVAAGSVATASAADLLVDVPAYEMASPVGDWTGPYLGAGVVVGNGHAVQGNVIGGVNVQSDSFVFGFEGWIGGVWWQGGAHDAAIGGLVRGGITPTPEVLLYVGLGAEHRVNAAQTYGLTAVGVEFMLTEDVSLDLRGGTSHSFNGGNAHSAYGAASVKFHF